jgi:hypothetical protein
MKKFSWYTIVHPDWQEGESPLFRLVGPAILPDEHTCDSYYKPNRKGGHRHNHIYNVCNRITFRGKKSRRVKTNDKKYFVSIFWENIALMPDVLNKILANKRKMK